LKYELLLLEEIGWWSRTRRSAVATPGCTIQTFSSAGNIGGLAMTIGLLHLRPSHPFLTAFIDDVNDVYRQQKWVIRLTA
jgi:hypothetical protein